MRTDHSCEAIGVCRESVHGWDSSSTHFIGGSALNVIRHLQRDHEELPQRWEWPPVCIKKDIQTCTYFSYCFHCFAHLHTRRPMELQMPSRDITCQGGLLG